MSNARRFFNCQPESVAGARHFVRDLLSDQPRETVEAVELMTSELATNSVRHARSDFELAIHISRDEIRVEVSDQGQGQPVPRSPTIRDLSGRGLQIVQELAEDWGITPSPNGKLVWFTVRLHMRAGERRSRSTASGEKALEQSHQPAAAPSAPPMSARPSASVTQPPRSRSRRLTLALAAAHRARHSTAGAIAELQDRRVGLRVLCRASGHSENVGVGWEKWCGGEWESLAHLDLKPGLLDSGGRVACQVTAPRDVRPEGRVSESLKA
jgi:anti-sigma regulatory factor (Ser/Thr protein kinase)